MLSLECQTGLLRRTTVLGTCLLQIKVQPLTRRKRPRLQGHWRWERERVLGTRVRATGLGLLDSSVITVETGDCTAGWACFHLGMCWQTFQLGDVLDQSRQHRMDIGFLS